MIAAAWLAVKAWFSSNTQIVVYLALIAAVGGSAAYLIHIGKKSQDAINAEKTIERAVEANKPVTDPERADIMRKYSRDGHELH